MRLCTRVALWALVPVVSCGGESDSAGGSPGGPDAAAVGSAPDGATPPVQADAAPAAQSCEPATPPPGWTYPSGPYGGDVGERFESFSLTDCDGDAVSFSDLLGDARLAYVNVAAGWCTICIRETRDIEEEIHQRFCGRGLRIVQVLHQDEEGKPADAAFCAEWRDRYRLTFPVVRDPTFTFGRYFSASQNPLILLVDRQGVIRYRSTHASPADLPDRIDALLGP